MLKVDEVDAPELPISWNVAPTQPVYAAVASQPTYELSQLLPIRAKNVPQHEEVMA